MSRSNKNTAFLIVSDGERHPSADKYAAGQMMYYKDKLYFNAFLSGQDRYKWALVTPHNVSRTLKLIKLAYADSLRGNTDTIKRVSCRSCCRRSCKRSSSGKHPRCPSEA
jgi:hypothetical protein